MTLVLGPNWQRDFWVSPFWLRFELADGDYVGRYTSRFTASYDRARELARMGIPEENLVGVIAALPDPSEEIGADWHGWTTGTGFDHLAELGLPTEGRLAEWEGYWWPDEEDDPEATTWTQRAIRLTWEEADILLWNQIAQDLGIAPRAPVLSKLVDLEQGVCVHAYDDRGLDFMSLTREPSQKLYSQCGSWLLDHERSRIATVFED